MNLKVCKITQIQVELMKNSHLKGHSILKFLSQTIDEIIGCLPEEMKAHITQEGQNVDLTLTTQYKAQFLENLKKLYEK